jgi:hypothetical protein
VPVPPTVRRLATFAWKTPLPTSVDEELAIFDDGSAWLVVRGPRTATPAIGTFRCEPVKADHRALGSAGPGTFRFDLLHPPADGPQAKLMAIADRVATVARKQPDAVATFSVAGTALGASSAPATLTLSLLVIASGTRAVQFRLDPEASSVLFGRDGQTLSWSELPRLASGFTTAEAVELGGVRRTARIEPGDYAAIAFDLSAPAGTSAISARVAGWLSSAPPDEHQPERFELLTDDAPIAF